LVLGHGQSMPQLAAAAKRLAKSSLAAMIVIL
jgi:hypothetical protein